MVRSTSPAGHIPSAFNVCILNSRELEIRNAGDREGTHHAGIWDTSVCARAVYVNPRSSIVLMSPVGEGLEPGEAEDKDCPVTTTLKL